jgi:hypothetical protein
MGWHRIRDQVEELHIGGHQHANLLDLVEAAEMLPEPQLLSVNPYDGGVSVHWPDRSIEVAVYNDRYETYHFRDGETDIKHWCHARGEALDPDLLAMLRALCADGS